MLGGKWSTVDEQLAVRETVAGRWRDAGGDPRAMRYAVLSYCHVTDSPEDARAFADNARFQMRLAAQLRDRPEVLVDGLLPELPPEVVAERLVALADGLRPDRLMLYFQMGNLPHAKVMRSIERFAAEVLPMVEREVGPVADIGGAPIGGRSQTTGAQRRRGGLTPEGGGGTSRCPGYGDMLNFRSQFSMSPFLISRACARMGIGE